MGSPTRRSLLRGARLGALGVGAGAGAEASGPSGCAGSPATGSTDPLSRNDMIARELQALQSLRGSAEGQPRTVSADGDTQSLLRRIEEVRRDERFRAAGNLLRLKVLRDFERLDLQLVPPLKGRGEAAFVRTDLRALATGFYPSDALELVREHVLSVIGAWDHLVRDYPLQLALFQVGEVYSMSALFGYSLRRAVLRYRLDRLAGGPGAAGRTLQDYVSAFGAIEMEQVVGAVSQEAQAVLDHRIFALFGDLGQLSAEVQAVMGAWPPEEAGEARLSQAIELGEVESVRVTVDDLRRLVLEGVAFGFLLGKAEADVDSVCELTPGESPCGLLLFGGAHTNEHHPLPGSKSSGSEFR